MVNYPKDWEKIELKYVCSYINGTAQEKYFTKYGSHKVISLGNYSESGEYLDDGNRINLIDVDKRYLVNVDELCMVLNDKGNGRLVGRAILIREDNKYIINQRSLKITLKKSLVNPEYMHKLINSKPFRINLKEIIQGNTEVYINPPMVMSLNIYLPPLEEQKAIAETLMAFNEHIEKLEELIAKKKMIRDGAVEDLMSGKTRLDGFDGEWESVKFSDYFRKLKNNTYSRDLLSNNGEIGNIHYGDVLIKFGPVLDDENYIPRVKSDVVIKKPSYLKENDVIIADTAEDETVGKATQVGDLDIPLVSGLHTIPCRPNFETAPRFLGYYIDSDVYHNQLLPYLTGIKVSSVSKQSIDETTLYIPTDIKEQKAIADTLTAMDNEIKMLKKEKEKIEKIKDGAMDDLLTGRVRLVKEA